MPPEPHNAPCDDLIRLQGEAESHERWRLDHERQHTEERTQRMKTDQRMFDKLDEAIKRPPPWVTVVVASLTCLVGVLAGALGIAVRFIEVAPK